MQNIKTLINIKFNQTLGNSLCFQPVPTIVPYTAYSRFIQHTLQFFTRNQLSIWPLIIVAI